MFYRRGMYTFSVQALEVQGNPKPKTPYKVSDRSSAQLPNFPISWKTSTRFALQPQRTHFNVSKQSHWSDSHLSPLAGINSNKSFSPTNSLHVFFPVPPLLLTFLYTPSVGIALEWEAQNLGNQFSVISFAKLMLACLTTHFSTEYFSACLGQIFQFNLFLYWLIDSFWSMLMALILQLAGDPWGNWIINLNTKA